MRAVGCERLFGPGERRRGIHVSNEFFIKSLLNGNVIDVRGNNPAPATQLISWPQKQTANANQRWAFVDEDAEGYGFIQSALNGFVMDIRGASPAPGAELIAYPRKTSGTENQRWRFEPGPGGALFIRSKLNQNVVDIRGSNSANGTELVSYPRKETGLENQIWSIEPAGISVDPLDYTARAVSGPQTVVLPVQKFVSVTCTAQSSAEQTVAIRDSAGEQVFECKGRSSKGGKFSTIGNGSFESTGDGLYVLELTPNAGILPTGVSTVYNGATYLTTYTYATNDGGAAAGDRDFNDLVVTLQVYRNRG